MKPRILLVGAGRFGINHLRNLDVLSKKGYLEFLGVVDTNTNLLTKIQHKFNVTCSNRIEDFLDYADAVDIVTPASTHYELTKLFLKKNKHVFVEKPLAESYKKAKELVKIAKMKKKILQTGHIFRYNKAVELIKNRIKNKNYYPFYIEGSFLQTTEPRQDVGAIFNYLHHFDILDNILQQNPKFVYACPNLMRTNPKRETNAIVNLQYPKCNVRLNLGWIASGKYRTLDLYSKKEIIRCDLIKQKIEIYQQNKLFKRMEPKHQEPLSLELKDFANSIKNKLKPKADGQIGARIVNVAELASSSIMAKKIIKFSK